MLIRRSAILIVFFTCLPLFAQDPSRKTGFTFFFGTPDNGISVRRRVTPDWTVLGTLSYSHNTQTSGSVGPESSTSWALGAGVRRVFASEELRPFIEVDGAIRRVNLPGCGHFSSPVVTAAGGVEYFFAKRVSVEGSAGLSYLRQSEHCTTNDGAVQFDYSAHSYGTFRSALSLTFWF